MMAVAALTERGIEQQFQHLRYQKLAKMVRLTPLEETISGQELIKNAHVAILAALSQDKFALSGRLSETVRADLDKLDAQALTTLVRQILHFDPFEVFEQWIEEHLPVQQA